MKTFKTITINNETRNNAKYQLTTSTIETHREACHEMRRRFVACLDELDNHQDEEVEVVMLFTMPETDEHGKWNFFLYHNNNSDSRYTLAEQEVYENEKGEEDYEDYVPQDFATKQDLMAYFFGWNNGTAWYDINAITVGTRW